MDTRKISTLLVLYTRTDKKREAKYGIKRHINQLNSMLFIIVFNVLF
jgi:hypothetical protein